MKRLMFAALVGCAMVSCEKMEMPAEAENGVTATEKVPTRKFKFTVKGDFKCTAYYEGVSVNNELTDEWGEAKTRASNAYMVADGKELTDMWVVDVVNGEVVQQLHQSPADADWGTPTMALAYGTHHVMFCASRGTSPVLSGTELRWEKSLDTFFKDYEVTVVSTSNGNRAVTLDRVSTGLKITIDDGIATGITAITAKPDVWYDGIDLKTGALLEAAGDKVASVAMSASDAGIKNLSLNFYWLAPVDEYETDVTLSAMKGAEAYTSVVLDGNFKANRKSEYHGTLFGSEGGSSVMLNATWLTSYNGGSWNE